MNKEIVIKKLYFPGSLNELSGHLVLSQAEPRAYAIYVHCFTCSKDHHSSRRISTELAQQGIATLRFDLTGLGESQGDFAGTNFTTNVQDIIAAAQYLKYQYKPATLLIGHSLGGTASLVAATQLEEMRAVVTLNSPYDPAHVAKRVASVKDEVFIHGEAAVQIEGRQFRIQKHFFEVLEHYNMEQILASLKAALLVMHAPKDPVVHIRNASQIFSSASHPKSFISLERMDHLLTDPKDALYIANLINAWASRYIDA
ncbi:MAG: hypothetical protein BGO77_00965 [Caedibacter sp. 37-49]|nr:MAG: hypothetical protein BGO77_00965 [Caedibacter sp. 37-49]